MLAESKIILYFCPMKKLILILLLASSCKTDKKYDGMILTDENTQKKYLLKKNHSAYDVYERIQQVSGCDTTYVYR